MRKFLLAATILAPFVVAPAFAGGGPEGGAIAGNLTGTVSISAGGVQASQGTQAGAMTVGNGASYQSATAGNFATINTNGYAKAGPGIAMTGTNTTQAQGGGTTVVSNTRTGWGFGNMAGGGATAGQTSTVLGGSAAAAGNVNGFVGMTRPHQGYGPR
jgi:hypothetical protein